MGAWKPLADRGPFPRPAPAPSAFPCLEGVSGPQSSGPGCVHKPQGTGVALPSRGLAFPTCKVGESPRLCWPHRVTMRHEQVPPLTKSLVSTYYVPGTVLGTDKAKNGTDRHLLWGLPWVGRPRVDPSTDGTVNGTGNPNCGSKGTDEAGNSVLGGRGR